MARRIKISPNEFYHVYNRGVDKRVIFLDDRDYERFLCLLFVSNSTKKFEISKRPEEEWSFTKVLEMDRGRQLVSVGAWCLMPNHFHLLIKEEIDGGISKFMAKLSTGYTMFFNQKYHRTGALFEGRFKATHADSDRFLKYLYSYIHLNAIGIIEKGWKKKHIEDIQHAQKFIKEFSYSSYRDYLGEDRPENKIISKASFPDYFESINRFEDMHNFWIENSEESFKK